MNYVIARRSHLGYQLFFADGGHGTNWSTCLEYAQHFIKRERADEMFHILKLVAEDYIIDYQFEIIEVE